MSAQQWYTTVAPPPVQFCVHVHTTYCDTSRVAGIILSSFFCSVEELCFGGYVLCDDYRVGVLLHDMARVEAYREGESHETLLDPSL